jgi:integrase
VRGLRYEAVEGKTPEISIEQARALLAAIHIERKNEKDELVPLIVGLRDRAIIATLIYTAARAGAVARLRIKDFRHDGSQWTFRFAEKGGKSREIPVRHDLQEYILAYLATIPDWQVNISPKRSLGCLFPGKISASQQACLPEGQQAGRRACCHSIMLS